MPKYQPDQTDKKPDAGKEQYPASPSPEPEPSTQRNEPGYQAPPTPPDKKATPVPPDKKPDTGKEQYPASPSPEPEPSTKRNEPGYQAPPTPVDTKAAPILGDKKIDPGKKPYPASPSPEPEPSTKRNEPGYQAPPTPVDTRAAPTPADKKATSTPADTGAPPTPADKKIDPGKKKCPPSPELDPKEFPKPGEPDGAYFAKLPEDKREAINEKKEGLQIAANETKQKTLAAAEDEMQLARSAHDIAVGKFNTAKDLLDLSSTNKKKQYWREYRQSLRKTLSESSLISQQDDIEKKRLDAKNAISIATLNQNLAVQELEYRNTYQQYATELATVENSFKLATDKYDATKCIAEAQEAIDRSSAETIWRQDLSDALASK